MPKFSVIIDRDSLRFSASHWVKFIPTQIVKNADGEISVQKHGIAVVEPLHGHTFRAKLKISGKPDDFGCVIDFVLAEHLLRAILEQFEHKILIAEYDPDMKLQNEAGQLHIKVLNRKWEFPAKDVKFLPAKSASTETIATIILDKFIQVLQKNNTMTAPFSDEQFVLTLEEETGMFAEIAYSS
ncbi:MAG: 6-carboxytetrahydropterin synthase [Planctomycetaceae bacterium]|jgi:6-pyruvoyl-tetrahydropterin synthase|nr:6-carboxytetrahydropterin synthase [Planctomycetaceae bacterium]